MLVMGTATSKAQVNPPIVQAELEINRVYADDASDVSYKYIGGEYVHLKSSQPNGTSYEVSPGPDQWMHARIDQNMVTAAPSGSSPFTQSEFDNQTTIDVSLPVGFTPGSHGVSAAGAATYSVPIQLPPGTNGMVPDLSVNYSSQSGNGILGMGWNLGGLSAISRLPKTTYHDQEIRGVQLDDEDWFALDGARLITTQGSEYATEQESFSKITSFGNYHGTGPEWFEVKTKDGRILQYGFTTDSKFLSEDLNGDNIPDAVIAYRVNKISDLFGNYIEFEYTNEDRQSRIKQIRYTGNSNAGIEPYNIIQFHYQERDDNNEAFLVGSSLKSSILLRKISIVADGAHFKNYEFDYGVSLYSQLKSVKEYGANGDQLNPTVFKYGEPVSGLSLEEITGIPNTDKINYFPGDFDGDGLTDIITVKFQEVLTPVPGSICQEAIDMIRDGQDPVALGYMNDEPCLDLNNINDDGFCECWASSLPQSLMPFGTGYEYRPYWIDDENWVNNPVFVYDEPQSQEIMFLRLYLGQGDNTFSAAGNPLQMVSAINGTIPFRFENARFSVIRNNGQRNAKLIVFGPENDNTESRMVALRSIAFNGSGLAIAESSDVLYAADNSVVSNNVVKNNQNHLVTGDFFGSGDVNLLSLFEFSTGSRAFFNVNFNPIQMNSQDVDFIMEADYFTIIDFNGDGKSEILARNGSERKIFGFNGNPEAAVCEVLFEENTPSYREFVDVGDFNGDGLTDLLLYHKTYDSWHIKYSNGVGYESAVIIPHSNFPDLSSDQVTKGNSKMHVGDYNGDGISDLFYFRPNGADNYEEDVVYFNGSVDQNGVVFDYQSYSQGIYDNWTMVAQPEEPCDEGWWIASWFFGPLLWIPCLVDDDEISYEAKAPVILPGDFNGDGKSDNIIYYQESQTPKVIYLNKDATQFQLQEAKNGTGFRSIFDYSWLPKAGDLYSKGTYNVPETEIIQSAIQVVSELSVSDGIGGISSTRYGYEGARIHRDGKGFLGFDKLITENILSDRKTVASFDVEPTFFFRRPTTTVTTTLGGQAIANQTFGYNYATNLGNLRFWSAPMSKTTTDAITGFNTFEIFGYDTEGNLTGSLMNNGADQVSSVFTYDTFGGWHVANRLTSSTTTTTRLSGGDSDSKSTEYLYNSNGFLVSQQSDPGSSKEVTNIFEPDVFGNVKKVTTAAPSVPWKVNKSVYDPKGRFAVSSTNSLNQESTITYDFRWGKPVSATGITGHTTSFQYDGFGGTVSATDALGTTTSTAYHWDTGTPGALYYTEETTTAQPTVRNWFDMLNRSVKNESQGFSELVSSSKTYNSLGQLASSIGIHGSTAGVEKTYSYNSNHQLQSVISVAGLASYGYTQDNGAYKTTVTSPLGLSSKWTDASGKLTASIDASNDKLHYTYDATGGVTSTKFESANAPMVTMTYDDWGFQTNLDDQNAGESKYEYNALGELVMQEVNGYQFNMTYDVAGRILTKTGPVVQYDSDGVLIVDANFKPITQSGTTTYQYVTSGNGLNQVKKVIGPHGTSVEYTYDEFGRTLSETETVDGLEFTTSYTYDSQGRVQTITHPTGVTVTNSYDSNGYLTSVVDGTETIFTANEANAYGQLTNYTLGNGLTTIREYDGFGRPQDIYTEDVLELMHQFEEGTGNLEWREKTSGPNILNEEFDYDDLNRLKDAEVLNSDVELHLTYEPNSSGNIKTKSDAGEFDYWPNRPNAVKSITNRVGNNLKDISLTTQDVAYSTEGRRVAMIAEGKYRAIFTYGIDNQRKKMVIEELVDGTIDEYKNYVERYYMGACERVKVWDENNGGVWTVYDLTYISGGDGLCAIHVKTDGNSGEYNYLYKDHLGSILVLTDAAGTVVGEQSFDAFGRYRNPDTWEVLNSDPYDEELTVDMPVWFSRGYTGHEHMREFDLINMNGRFYDPIPGRMLSADNHVQEPGSSQSYNRYSYAFNNPLKYTDPSGEFNVWAALGAAAAAAGISYLGNVVNNNFEMNPNNWTSGSVTVGLASNGSTVDLFGGGSIAGNSFIAGRNTSTGIWGGGSSSFGQASYSQMPSYSLGKINMGIVNSYMPQNRPAGLPDYNRGAQTAKQFVADFKLGWGLGWYDDGNELACDGCGGGDGGPPIKSKTNWKGIVDASIGVTGGVLEVTGGVLLEGLTGGISTFMIIDGVGRIGMNTIRLAAYATNNSSAGNSLPTNFGGMAGKIFDGAVSGNGFLEVGTGQMAGEIVNDAVGFTVGGGSNAHVILGSGYGVAARSRAMANYTYYHYGNFRPLIYRDNQK